MKTRHLLIVLLAICASISFVFLKKDTTIADVAKTAMGETKTFHLYAADMQQEMAQGTTLYSWGYGLWDPEKNAPASPPSIPGPELRVKEGDHVKVVFHNQQSEPHTIHFHGIDNSFAGDGTPDVSQHGTMKGETFTYEFDARQAGTYFYHCHVEPDRHPEMGLYGAFIVEPKAPKYKTDGEFTLLLAERDPLLSKAEGTESHHYVGSAAEHLQLDGEYNTADRKARFYTINGKMNPEVPEMHVKQGQTYLIRLINAGSEVHTFHTHGHHFKVVASDGRDIQNPEEKDTITIGPGEKYDLLLTANNPGIWPVHCHIGPHESHGMHMMMVYDNMEHNHNDNHNNQENHNNMTHGNSDPIGRVKHHLTLLKQYQFENNNEQMKSEIQGLKQELQAFYNFFSTGRIDELNDLEGSADAVIQQLNSNANSETVKKSIEALEQKINQLEEMLQGDPS